MEAGQRVYEILGDPRDAGAFLFTCEHASHALPEHVNVSARDREVLPQHWGWDIGALAVTEKLVDNLGGQAVVARYSRLWVDLNRAEEATSLMPTEVEGAAISFNQGLRAEARSARIEGYWTPYHEAVLRTGRERAALESPFEVLSIHSFTPVYRDEVRTMEVGVLFNEYDERAERLADAIRDQGFDVAMNEPYSGKPPERLIFAAEKNGRALGVPYLELEIRQDLIADSESAAAVGQRISEALKHYSKVNSKLPRSTR